MTEQEKAAHERDAGMIFVLSLGTETKHPPRYTAGSLDTSGQLPDKMWAIYLGEAEKIDKHLVEDWKGTMDGILIFVRPIPSTHIACPLLRVASGRSLLSSHHGFHNRGL